MEIIKLVSLGILISTIIVIIKQVKPELAISVSVVGSIIMLLFILNSFSNVFNIFNQVIEKTGINNELFTILLKIIGVGYLVEFSADICSDSGNTSIANHIILGGKVLIFILSIPVITNLLEIILGLVQW